MARSGSYYNIYLHEEVISLKDRVNQLEKTLKENNIPIPERKPRNFTYDPYIGD